MKLTDYLTSHLEKITDSIFLVSGGGCMHTVDSIRKSKLNAYCCHHEQACALAAEGYARMKNKIGVASVTTGPGGTNAITGVASAWMDNIPIMIISGQVRKEIMLTREDKERENPLRQLGPQEINIVDIVKPITKYAKVIENPESIRAELEKAHYLAISGKPGPVWLDIPLDVQNAEINQGELPEYVLPKRDRNIQPLVLEDIVNKINKSSRPLAIVGNGIRLSGGVESLYKFLDKTGINVVSAMSGDDLVTEDYPYYLGRQGITGNETANSAIDNCDLLLILGTRMQIRQTSFEYDRFAKNAYKIMVDIDEAELKKKTLKLDIPVQADVKDFLESIIEKELKLKKWNVEKKPFPIFEEKKGYIDVYRFIEELSGKTDYPIVTTNGMACEATHQRIRLNKGQRLMTNTALGEMGKGLPMAIGACIANGKNPVICMEGDGSIMMNIQEIQTMKYHNLPIKIFLFNNGGYFSIRNTHNAYFKNNFASDESCGLSLPNWSKLAPAWGIEYHQIKSIDDFKRIENSLHNKEAGFYELFIDTGQKMLPKWSA